MIHSSTQDKFYKRNWNKLCFRFYWFSKACNKYITIKPIERKQIYWESNFNIVKYMFLLYKMQWQFIYQVLSFCKQRYTWHVKLYTKLSIEHNLHPLRLSPNPGHWWILSYRLLTAGFGTIGFFPLVRVGDDVCFFSLHGVVLTGPFQQTTKHLPHPS